MPLYTKTISVIFVVLVLTICSTYSSAGQNKLFPGSLLRTELSSSEKNFINLPPVAQNIFVTTFEDKPVSGTLLGTDPDGDPLHYSIITPPNHGTATINLDGTYDYQPNAHYFGTDSFTYQATDPAGASDTAIVDILVDQVNTFPTVYD